MKACTICVGLAIAFRSISAHRHPNIAALSSAAASSTSAGVNLDAGVDSEKNFNPGGNGPNGNPLGQGPQDWSSPNGWQRPPKTNNKVWPQQTAQGAPEQSSENGSPQPTYGDGNPQTTYGGANTQPTIGNGNPQSSFGVAQPSYGAAQSSYGAAQSLYGNGSPQSSYGEGNPQPTLGNGNPQSTYGEGNTSPTLGNNNPSPTLGNSSPTQGNPSNNGTNTNPSGVASGTGSAPVVSGTGVAEAGKVCINWEGTFAWTMTGGFATAAQQAGHAVSGEGGSEASMCFGTDVVDAGMFICENSCSGAGDAATAKYTKFECTLGTQYPNCDMSIVDGFSLAAACTFESSAGQVTIGGTDDLFDLATCPTPGGDNTCNNANSYGSSADGVSEFFQNGVKNGNNYCNFQTCDATSDPGWAPDKPPVINCKVGGGKNSKRSLNKPKTAESTMHEHKRSTAYSLADSVKRGIHGAVRHHARNLKAHF